MPLLAMRFFVGGGLFLFVVGGVVLGRFLIGFLFVGFRGFVAHVILSFC